MRFWADVTNWPENRLPTAGENVTINGSWNMIMDIQPESIEFLQVDGNLFISENIGDIHLICNSIWIRAGSIKAGTSSQPFPNKLTF